MKTLLVTVLFAVALISSVFGQERQDTTDTWLNGTGWKSFERLQKFSWLEGFYEGQRALAGDLLNVAPPNQRKLVAEKVSAYLIRQRLSDRVAQIDDFYKDQANAHIPVVRALLWVAQKNKGKSGRELGELLARYRRQWNK